MNVTLLDNGFLLATPASLGAAFSKLSAMPGRKRWTDRSMMIQPSGINLEYMTEHWPDAQWDEKAKGILDSYIQLKIEEDTLRADKLTNLTDPSGYVYKTTPYAHQAKSFILNRDRKAWAHFHPPGSGKSKIVIDTAAYLYEQGKIDCLIIIAPNGVHSNWIINEIPAHMPDRIPVTSGWYSSKHGAKPYKELTNNALNREALKVIAFNIEGFTSINATSLIEMYLTYCKCMVAVDESSRIKNPSADRTKYLIKIGSMADYKRILTGTPVTRGVENLYPQFKFLDSRILGHETFTTFRSEYCVMGGFENRQIVGYKSTDKLIRIMDGHSDRIRIEDCIDLPPRIYKRHIFQMDGKQRKLYDAFRKNSLTELQALLGEDEGLKRARELAITKFIRLHQIACGLSPDKEMKPLFDDPKDDPRYKALMEVLEDAEDQKRIIWARFNSNLRYIYRLLGTKALPLWGDTPEKERINSLNRFQHENRFQWLVAHTQVAGIGYTLTAAGGAVYHSNLSDLELRLQSEDRCRRIGSEGFEHIIYTDIEAERSIDRKIINRLRSLKQLADEITGDPTSAFLTED